MRLCCCLVPLAAFISCLAAAGETAPNGDSNSDPARKRNVLYVVYDDLRPDLSLYGNPFIHSPNMQKLADKGVVFDRAYVQIAVCSPSRMSFSTGRRPNSTKTWNFINHFRCACVCRLVSPAAHHASAPTQHMNANCTTRSPTGRQSVRHTITSGGQVEPPWQEAGTTGIRGSKTGAQLKQGASPSAARRALPCATRAAKGGSTGVGTARCSRKWDPPSPPAKSMYPRPWTRVWPARLGHTPNGPPCQRTSGNARPPWTKTEAHHDT